ncbi:MAG: hypothetical protein JW395_0326 [Nitrospira sp.]|nr:hypothetical protein [Nitrospira sp.]
MPEDPDQLAALAPEDIKIAGVRVASQRLLDAQRQRVHAAAHTGLDVGTAIRSVLYPHRPQNKAAYAGGVRSTYAPLTIGGVYGALRTASQHSGFLLHSDTIRPPAES